MAHQRPDEVLVDVVREHRCGREHRRVDGGHDRRGHGAEPDERDGRRAQVEQHERQRELRVLQRQRLPACLRPVCTRARLTSQASRLTVLDTSRKSAGLSEWKTGAREEKMQRPLAR